MPFCGVQEYARASALQEINRRTAEIEQQSPDSGYRSAERRCYQEEGREMCTVLLTMCPCADGHVARITGLSKTFCNIDDKLFVESNYLSCISVLAESNGPKTVSCSHTVAI